MSVMFYNKFDGAAVSTVRNSNSLVPTIAARAAVTPKTKTCEQQQLLPPSSKNEASLPEL